MRFAHLPILFYQLLRRSQYFLSLRNVWVRTPELCCVLKFSGEAVAQVDLLQFVLTLLESEAQVVESADPAELEAEAVEEGRQSGS